MKPKYAKIPPLAHRPGGGFSVGQMDDIGANYIEFRLWLRPPSRKLRGSWKVDQQNSEVFPNFRVLGHQSEEALQVVEGGLGGGRVAREEQVEAVLGVGEFDADRGHAGIYQLVVQGAGNVGG